MSKKSGNRNPTDATMRNAQASKNRDAKLEARIKRLESYVEWVFGPSWKRTLRKIGK